MKIAVVNDIHIGEPLSHDGKMRAASHLAEDALPRVLKDIESWHKPDLLVNLGDLIRRESPELDRQRYWRAMKAFKELDTPVLHLLGNHELVYMDVSTIEKLWAEEGFEQSSYGIKDCGSFAVLWLGLELFEGNYSIRTLPEEQVEWLQETLQSVGKPVIIFSHVPLDSQDMQGNFFYEAFCVPLQKQDGLFLQNQEKMREVIEQSDVVKMVIQGHLHYYHANLLGSIPYITCPAMGDNLCAPNIEEIFPEVYTILNVEEAKLTVKAYSRRYCFSGSQWPMKDFPFNEF